MLFRHCCFRVYLLLARDHAADWGQLVPSITFSSSGGHGNRVVQCTALLSLICALISLILGCLYLIRFETMRRPYKAMQWALVSYSAVSVLHSPHRHILGCVQFFTLPLVERLHSSCSTLSLASMVIHGHPFNLKADSTEGRSFYSSPV